MATHAIIELEEGTLNIVVGERAGSGVRVVRSLRLPLADLRQDTVQNALRAAGADALGGASGAHVVLGERRSKHFLSTVPRMSPGDAVAFVRREALRLTNLQTADDVLLATRFVRKVAGGRLVLATSVVPSSTWSPIARAFEAAGVPVLGLHTMESCLALATTAALSEPVAVVECNAGRARFVLCVDQTPIQVRRFLVGGGGEPNAATLTTQLMMELPRTFDWLRETGQPIPKWLVLGTRVPVDEQSLDMLRGEDLEQISRAAPPVELGDGLPAPSLGAATLLGRVCAGAASGSLLDAPRLRLPWGPGRIAAVLGAASIGVLCAASAVVDTRAWLTARSARDDVQALRAALEADLADVDEAARSASPSADPVTAEALEAALAMRRPVSRLIAEVSNLAEARVHIEKLEFASTSRVVISGVVDGEDRQHALEVMAGFAERLRELPYLQADGHEEVGEAGASRRLRFELGLSWRNP